MRESVAPVISELFHPSQAWADRAFAGPGMREQWLQAQDQAIRELQLVPGGLGALLAGRVVSENFYAPPSPGLDRMVELLTQAGSSLARQRADHLRKLLYDPQTVQAGIAAHIPDDEG